MARVAVLSDTHSYDDLRETVPEWVVAEVETADYTVHAGDFVAPTALEFFRDLAADLVAVRGNADVGVDLPEVATLTVEGVRLVVTHPPDVEDASLDRAAYDRAVVAAVESVGEMPSASDDRPVVAVAGHTHRVIDEVVGGVRLLNPGSATGALPAERPTMLRLQVTGGTVDVTVLDPEGSESDPGE
ncbi:MAG: YfcE family phosphodiesterase [Haloarculaceae archaeon]